MRFKKVYFFFLIGIIDGERKQIRWTFKASTFYYCYSFRAITENWLIGEEKKLNNTT